MENQSEIPGNQQIRSAMKAMVIDEIVDLKLTMNPLRLAELPVPVPSRGDILLEVNACGICHTELDEIEGRTPPSNFPMIPGHQVVGTVIGTGDGVKGFQNGSRVGVAWIFSSCGKCEYCSSGNENLCPEFKATGRDAMGGYAEYMTVPASSAIRLPENISDIQAAPLLCAGAIGYRSLRLTNLSSGQLLGLTGFGASAHLVMKMVPALLPDTRVFVFARNQRERDFARELGAVWAGNTDERSPEKLHAIIDTTPVWKPVVEAMANLRPGGRLVINAIRKEDADKEVLVQLDYTGHLWMEREIKSVANVTRQDVQEFLRIAGQMAIVPEVQLYRLEEANKALVELKQGNICGAKVIVFHP